MGFIYLKIFCMMFVLHLCYCFSLIPLKNLFLKSVMGVKYICKIEWKNSDSDQNIMVEVEYCVSVVIDYKHYCFVRIRDQIVLQVKILLEVSVIADIAKPRQHVNKNRESKASKWQIQRNQQALFTCAFDCRSCRLVSRCYLPLYRLLNNITVIIEQNICIWTQL